ncbi:hypothetical protein AB974_003814 [Escherichia coli]|nr:hypothetical protein [Escherichia coli]
MKRIINFGLLLGMYIGSAAANESAINWTHTATPVISKLTATVTGRNHTTNEVISETSRELILNYAGKLWPAIRFNTQYLFRTHHFGKPINPEYRNIGDLGKCLFRYADGSISTYDNVGMQGTPLVHVHGGIGGTYLILREKAPILQETRPFLSAECETYKIDNTKKGGDKLEYRVKIRNSGYKNSELNVTPTSFTVQADSNGKWKVGPITAHVTNLSTVDVTVKGGDVILEGKSNSEIKEGEQVKIYSIPKEFVDGYDTVSSGAFYLSGTAKKFGKNTYTVTITHNPV